MTQMCALSGAEKRRGRVDNGSHELVGLLIDSIEDVFMIWFLTNRMKGGIAEMMKSLLNTGKK